MEPIDEEKVQEVFNRRIARQFEGVDLENVRRLYRKEHEYLVIVYTEGKESPKQVTPDDQFLVDTLAEARTHVAKTKKFVLYSWYTLWGQVVVRAGQILELNRFPRTELICEVNVTFYEYHIDKPKSRLLIDTGSTDSFIFLNDAEWNKVNKKNKKEVYISGVLMECVEVDTPTATLGGDDLNAEFFLCKQPTKDGIVIDAFSGLGGILGMNILFHCTLVFNKGVATLSCSKDGALMYL